MKTYQSTRNLLAEIEQVLTTNRPSTHHSPLEEIIRLLCQGRHYSWMGVYLAVTNRDTKQLLGSGNDTHPGQMALPETRTKILVAMRIAGREIGVLDIESEHDHAFGSEDLVLLENVAGKLARFLTGPGKYLVRKARQAASNGK